MADVMRMKPLVGLLVLCGNLSWSEVGGAVHDNLAAGLITAGLSQQGPKVSIAVILWAASPLKIRRGNLFLSANVPLLGGFEKPLFCLAIVLFDLSAIGIAHAQRVFRPCVTLVSALAQFGQAPEGVTIRRGVGFGVRRNVEVRCSLT